MQYFLVSHEDQYLVLCCFQFILTTSPVFLYHSSLHDLVLYADDVLLYRSISCQDDILLLQSDIDTIRDLVY